MLIIERACRRGRVTLGGTEELADGAGSQTRQGKVHPHALNVLLMDVACTISAVYWDQKKIEIPTK